MRIESAAFPAAPTPHRSSKPEQVTTTTPAPASSSAAASPPVATPSKHGNGAEHRSDVATLRQWVNHPDQRAAIVLPDLTSTPRGHGFATAVAAYQAALAELAPPPAPPAAETPPVAPVAQKPVVETPPAVDTPPVEPSA